VLLVFCALRRSAAPPREDQVSDDRCQVSEGLMPDGWHLSSG